MGTFLRQWRRASRYPEKAKCCTGAQEQRKNQSLELSSFLGAARSLDFSSSPKHDSQPFWGCVLLMWSQLVIAPASLCPHCRFCYHSGPGRLLQSTLCCFFFFPHTNFFGWENSTAWYRSYNLPWSVQESLFEVLLSSAVCLSLTRSSLRWQTRLKITWKQLGAISCDPSPQSVWQWWQDFCQGGEKI